MSQRWIFHWFVPYSTQSAILQQMETIQSGFLQRVQGWFWITHAFQVLKNHSRNFMANHLHPLPGRSGSNCRKLHKKQQLHFGAKFVSETSILFKKKKFFFLSWVGRNPFSHVPFYSPFQKKEKKSRKPSSCTWHEEKANGKVPSITVVPERLNRKDENNC